MDHFESGSLDEILEFSIQRGRKNTLFRVVIMVRANQDKTQWTYMVTTQNALNVSLDSEKGQFYTAAKNSSLDQIKREVLVAFSLLVQNVITSSGQRLLKIH